MSEETPEVEKGQTKIAMSIAKHMDAVKIFFLPECVMSIIITIIHLENVLVNLENVMLLKNFNWNDEYSRPSNKACAFRL